MVKGIVIADANFLISAADSSDSPPPGTRLAAQAAVGSVCQFPAKTITSVWEGRFELGPRLNRTAQDLETAAGHVYDAISGAALRAGGSAHAWPMSGRCNTAVLFGCACRRPRVPDASGTDRGRTRTRAFQRPGSAADPHMALGRISAMRVGEIRK